MWSKFWSRNPSELRGKKPVYELVVHRVNSDGRSNDEKSRGKKGSISGVSSLTEDNSGVRPLTRRERSILFWPDKGTRIGGLATSNVCAKNGLLSNSRQPAEIVAPQVVRQKKTPPSAGLTLLLEKRNLIRLAHLLLCAWVAIEPMSYPVTPKNKLRSHAHVNLW